MLNLYSAKGRRTLILSSCKLHLPDDPYLFPLAFVSIARFWNLDCAISFRVAAAEYLRVVKSKNSFLIILEARKFKAKVPEDLVSGKSLVSTSKISPCGFHLLHGRKCVSTHSEIVEVENQTPFFDFISIFIFQCMCLWPFIPMSQAACGSQRTTCRTSSLFPPCGNFRLTQVIRLSGKGLYPLWHLPGPNSLFSNGPVMIPLSENRTFVA